jgi:signal peptidase
MSPPAKIVTRRRLSLFVMVAAVVTLLLLPTVVRTSLGIGVTTVLTGSMRPAIDAGDLIITKTSDASTIRVGDVVVVETAGLSVAHRVVETRPLSGLNRLTTQGDANAEIDRDPVIVSPAHQVPRVIWRVPEIGSPLAFLASADAQRLAVTLLVAANLIALTLFAVRRRPVGNASQEGSREAARPALLGNSSTDA